MLCGAALLGGCGANSTGDGRPAFTPAAAGDSAGEAGGSAADLDALLPARMRIHPLTRFERAPSAAPGKAEPNAPLEPGPWQIACHIELRDGFGHTAKGLGRLRIELYRPVSDQPGASEAQDAVWNIDLRNPRENASVYDDLITRTYTVYLASLPRWVSEWATRAEERRSATGQPGLSAAGSAGDEFVTLKAYFITFDRTGRERVFEHTYRIPG